MGPIWPEIVTVLEKLPAIGKVEEKKSKKRKAAVLDGVDEGDLVSELKLAAQLALESVKTCCVHDNIDFIDQVCFCFVICC